MEVFEIELSRRRTPYSLIWCELTHSYDLDVMIALETVDCSRSRLQIAFLLGTIHTTNPHLVLHQNFVEKSNQRQNKNYRISSSTEFY